VNLHEALVYSCNVYFYQVGRGAGIDALTKWGDRFGLGRATGVDLPGESRGVLPSDAWKRKVRGEPWYAGDTISVSIGQGLLAVTPLQMATLVAAVANGGKLVRPHLLASDSREPTDVGVSAET
jgi:penicillin-binding protein 2